MPDLAEVALHLLDLGLRERRQDLRYLQGTTPTCEAPIKGTSEFHALCAAGRRCMPQTRITARTPSTAKCCS